MGKLVCVKAAETLAVAFNTMVCGFVVPVITPPNPVKVQSVLKGTAVIVMLVPHE